MKTTLVTGGAGFIGSALVRRLVTQSRQSVVTIDKLTYAGNLDSLAPVTGSPSHVFERVDVCDGGEVRRVLETYKPLRILHLAAESHVDRSIDGPADFVRTNVQGTFTMLQEALRYWERLPQGERERFRFIHVSTDEVFGSLGATGLFSHDSPYDPSSPYSATKAASDHLARAWHRTYGLPVIVTNCSNNYGPYHFPEKLIPLTILNALEEHPLPVYGRGENVRDWLFVEDHAAALEAAANSGVAGATYLFGGNAERRNIDVVRSICRILDELSPMSNGRSHEDLITFVSDRPGHDLRYAVDTTRSHEELHWRPAESFESGLLKTVRWYLDNRNWWERVRSGVYRGERLGLTSNTGENE